MSLLESKDSTAAGMTDLDLVRLWMLVAVRGMKVLVEVLTFVVGMAGLE